MCASDSIEWRCLRWVLPLFLAICSPAFADVQYSDGTFDLSNYDIRLFTNLPAGDTYSLAQFPSGGNPGSWVAADISTAPNASGALIGWALMNRTWTYTPEIQGQVLDLSFSMDRLDSVVTDPDEYERARIVILQNSTYYYYTALGQLRGGAWETIKASGINNDTTVDTDNHTGWNSFDFDTGVITPGAHPDFSAQGSTMSFGLGLGSEPSRSRAVTVRMGADNLTIGISSVPEPTIFVLLLAGIAVVGSALHGRQHAEPRAG
jgi:hypothetical protein